MEDSIVIILKKLVKVKQQGAIAVIVYNKDNGSTTWTDDLKTMGIVNNDAICNKNSIYFHQSFEDGEQYSKEYK